eukprot:gene13045-biopygen6520
MRDREASLESSIRAAEAVGEQLASYSNGSGKETGPDGSDGNWDGRKARKNWRGPRRRQVFYRFRPAGTRPVFHRFRPAEVRAEPLWLQPCPWSTIPAMWSWDGSDGKLVQTEAIKRLASQNGRLETKLERARVSAQKAVPKRCKLAEG